MTIQQTSFCTFRLKFKSGEVVINPTGKVKEGIVLFSLKDSPYLKYDVEEGTKLLVDAAGEYEADDIFVMGEKVKGSETVVYTVSSEDLTIGVISFVNEIDSIPEDFFANTDILLLNAGGGAFFTPKQAENVYQTLSPKKCILFGFSEQAGSRDRVDLFSVEEAKKDIEAADAIDKTLKIASEELTRVENTEVHFFTI